MITIIITHDSRTSITIDTQLIFAPTKFKFEAVFMCFLMLLLRTSINITKLKAEISNRIKNECFLFVCRGRNTLRKMQSEKTRCNESNCDCDKIYINGKGTDTHTHVRMQWMPWNGWKEHNYCTYSDTVVNDDNGETNRIFAWLERIGFTLNAVGLGSFSFHFSLSFCWFCCCCCCMHANGFLYVKHIFDLL